MNGSSQLATDREIAVALARHLGSVAAAAKELSSLKLVRISRAYIAGRVDRSAALTELVEDLRESLLDQAEATLFKKVRAGDMETSKFILLTLGKHRGYARTVKVEAVETGELVARMAAARAASRQRRVESDVSHPVVEAEPAPVPTGSMKPTAESEPRVLH